MFKKYGKFHILLICHRAENRKMNPLFEPNLSSLSKELLNNIINGTVLHGYLKVL